VQLPAYYDRADPTSNAHSRTRSRRDADLSREDQQVSEAIRSSLAQNAQAFGGLTYQQLLDLQTRDLTPEDYERLLMLDETVAKRTLSAAQIAALPRSRFVAVAGAAAAELCTVCQSAYAADEELLTLPRCQHRFHADCVSQWLSTASTKCPLCTVSLEM